MNQHATNPSCPRVTIESMLRSELLAARIGSKITGIVANVEPDAIIFSLPSVQEDEHSLERIRRRLHEDQQQRRDIDDYELGL